MARMLFRASLDSRFAVDKLPELVARPSMGNAGFELGQPAQLEMEVQRSPPGPGPVLSRRRFATNH